MTAVKDLRAELTRLQSRAPSAIASFNEARTARIAEIGAILATATIEQAYTVDAALEKCLRRSRGGDAIGRR